MSIILFIIIAFVVFFFVSKILRKFKVPKIGSLVLVTGGVKCGKSTFAVGVAIKTYKRNLRRVKFINFFRRLFKRDLIEEPLLYSNVPLGCPYVPVTKDIINRSVRLRYKSVMYIQEASLFADSRLIDNATQNNALMVFNKLVGHETRGGTLIYDTQCVQDLHYSIKRSISNYFYIHSTHSVPFFIISKCRELIHSEDNDIINAFNKDIEEDMKKVLFSKKVWKYFDTYCYACLTDNLPVAESVVNNTFDSDLQCYDIVSFRKEFNISLGGSNERKENINNNR